MVGGESATLTVVAGYLVSVVGRRGGREKFGSETQREGESWKRPDG
jgi:hypothetical protein